MDFDLGQLFEVEVENSFQVAGLARRRGGVRLGFSALLRSAIRAMAQTAAIIEKSSPIQDTGVTPRPHICTSLARRVKERCDSASPGSVD